MRDHDDYRARKIAEFREKTRVCIYKNCNCMILFCIIFLIETVYIATS